MHKPLLTRTGTAVFFFFLGVESQNLAAVFEHPQMLILNSVSAQSQQDYLLNDYFRQHLAQSCLWSRYKHGSTLQKSSLVRTAPHFLQSHQAEKICGSVGHIFSSLYIRQFCLQIGHAKPRSILYGHSIGARKRPSER